MNPSIYDQIKKNDSEKKRIKQKFIFALVLSNILIALGVSQFFMNQNQAQTESRDGQERPIYHSHYKLVVIPIKNLVPFNRSQKETPISLLSIDNKVVIAKAYLHPKVQTQEGDLSKEFYQIELPETEIIKILDKKNEILIAVPQIDIQLMTHSRPHRQKESKYEIHF